MKSENSDLFQTICYYVENKNANTATHSKIQAPVYKNTQQPKQNGT